MSRFSDYTADEVQYLIYTYAAGDEVEGDRADLLAALCELWSIRLREERDAISASLDFERSHS